MKKDFTWEEKAEIYRLRSEACKVIADIDKCFNDKDELIKPQFILAQYKQQLEDIEFEMQDAWGFERDANKHTWWLNPKHCKCPKMDNTDPAYFGGGKIITEDCPVHGNILKK